MRKVEGRGHFILLNDLSYCLARVLVNNINLLRVHPIKLEPSHVDNTWHDIQEMLM